MKKIALFLFILILGSAKIFSQTPVKTLRYNQLETRQVTTAFKTENVSHFVKANDNVTVLETDGLKKETTLAALKFNDQIKTVSYNKNVEAIDNHTASQLQKLLGNEVAIQQIKVIPEMHFDKALTGRSFRIVFTSVLPFIYSKEQNLFKSKLGFFLIEDPVSEKLSAIDPIDLTVASDDIHSISPQDITIASLYRPLVNIELADQSVLDSVKIRIVTATKPEGYPTFVKVIPALDISAERSSIQGLGIQEVPVTVRFMGSRSNAKRKVNFQAEKGTVTPSSIEVSLNEPTTVMLRSEGIGIATITATSNEQKSHFSIEYGFPSMFLIASVIGGLIGAAIKIFNSNIPDKNVIKPLALGALFGFLGAGLYYVLGLNVLQFELSHTFNEFAVLIFSGTCALVGVPKKLISP